MLGLDQLGYPFIDDVAFFPVSRLDQCDGFFRRCPGTALFVTKRRRLHVFVAINASKGRLANANNFLLQIGVSRLVLTAREAQEVIEVAIRFVLALLRPQSFDVVLDVSVVRDGAAPLALSALLEAKLWCKAAVHSLFRARHETLAIVWDGFVKRPRRFQVIKVFLARYNNSLRKQNLQRCHLLANFHF